MNDQTAVTPIPEENHSPDAKEESHLYRCLRDNCPYYCLLAAVTGTAYALFFCKIHGSGINVFAFSVVWIFCQQLAFHRLGMANLRRDAIAIISILLLSASVFWTANVFVQDVSSLGTMGMMMLLLLGAFADCWGWNFRQFFRGFFSLAFSTIGKLPEPFIHLQRRRSSRGPSI